MHSTPEQLFAYLDQLGIEHRTVTHPPLFTVEQSRQLRGRVPGGHSKNLLLKDKRDHICLVVALEDAVIDLKHLHLRLGTGRFSFASAAQMRSLIGVDPGTVTPFALINDTDRVLDAAMLAEPILNFHPLVNTMTTTVSREDLVTFLEATGHPPRILAVSESADAAGDGASTRAAES
jgi:Ala-tRNA(Pro) deacylase